MIQGETSVKSKKFDSLVELRRHNKNFGQFSQKIQKSIKTEIFLKFEILLRFVNFLFFQHGRKAISKQSRKKLVKGQLHRSSDGPLDQFLLELFFIAPGNEHHFHSIGYLLERSQDLISEAKGVGLVGGPGGGDWGSPPAAREFAKIFERKVQKALLLPIFHKILQTLR